MKARRSKVMRARFFFFLLFSHSAADEPLPPGSVQFAFLANIGQPFLERLRGTLIPPFAVP